MPSVSIILPHWRSTVLLPNIEWRSGLLAMVQVCDLRLGNRFLIDVRRAGGIRSTPLGATRPECRYLSLRLFTLMNDPLRSARLLGMSASAVYPYQLIHHNTRFPL